MKKILIIIFMIWLFPSVVSAATHTASSCSYADVLAAYSACNDGDTLVIPAGSATWSSTLEITKELIVRGAGYDCPSGTSILCTGTNTLIQLKPSSDKAIDLSGIHFQYSTNNPGGTAVSIRGDKTGGYELTQIRVHDCQFEKGTRAVYCRGWVEPCIDNNLFLNNNISVMVLGDDDHSWGRAIEAGTANAVFIEDNTFRVTNDADREPNHLIYHQQGGRSVTRYNLFDGSTYTNGNFIFYDTHGNWGYPDNTAYRGQPILEIYENTITAHHSYGINGMRGGSMLVWNNTFTTSQGSAPYLTMTEEDCWSTAHFGASLDSTWSAQDQHFNCFFWGNTFNGNAQSSSYIYPKYKNSSCTALDTPYACCTGSGTGTCDDFFIQEDRDYFMHEPQSSGGYESWSGAAGADDGLVWNAAGANAYYPYTPYTYPHPLRGGTQITVSNSKGSDLMESDIVTGVTVYYTITGDTFTADSVTSGNTNDQVQAGFSSNRSETYGFINTVQANWSDADFSLNAGCTQMAVWFQDSNYDPTQVEETISFEVPGAAATSGVTQTADTFSIGASDNPPSSPVAGSTVGPGISLSNQGMTATLDDNGVKVGIKEE